MQTVILCGGKGTRSYPFTEYFPKVMMPIGGTPVIVHLMKIYAAQGFRDFVLAAGHRQEILVDYFNGRFEDWSVRIVDTGENADTGERVARCRPYLSSRFFATYGDGLGDVDLHQLLDTHVRTGGLATVTTVPLRSQYGTVDFDGDGRVQRFREKPVIRDCWINAGFFVIENRAFDSWTGRNLETDVLPHFASTGDLFTHQHDGFWKSMDTSKDQMELEQVLSMGAPPWLPAPLLHNRTATA
ncbi:sugar phosphate nucleotidyltransferase [uncultured Paludibaculum sp.]|uniref:sugar phosphate nucleotidyltransferase n=1 Tax=uncultured Paludibaculum sp. TaxID=1765020 RepID=UPI002AAC4A90|nr:sugar phosphate nucleotidyltransferase [uncultured Paludibaculum sp.]